MATSRDYEGVLDICVAGLISQVRNFTEDQLQSLLDDEKRLNAMVDAMPQVSSLPNDKELKLAQSKSLAEYNLSIEPQLRIALSKLHETHANAVKTKEEVENMKATLDSVAESRSLDTVCASLKSLTQEAEDESEKVAEQFRNGTLDIDEFVKKHHEKRVMAHTRRVKSEKLDELLRQQSQYRPVPTAASANNRFSAGGMSMPSPGPAMAAPYPAYSNNAYPSLGQAYAGPNANYRHSYMS